MLPGGPKTTTSLITSGSPQSSGKTSSVMQRSNCVAATIGDSCTTDVRVLASSTVMVNSQPKPLSQSLPLPPQVTVLTPTGYVAQFSASRAMGLPAASVAVQPGPPAPASGQSPPIGSLKQTRAVQP